MSPLVTLAGGLLTLAALAAVAGLLEGVAARRRRRILDETLPPPDWACKRLRNDGLTVGTARVRS
jgi:hypothetical protein